jgi:tetratricopeptide (TPR) repeat protein
VGRYLVLDEVGAGGMGVVFAAYDPDLDRKVAVKLLWTRDGKGVRSSDSGARLFREAQAMARLAHPNVVAIYDVGTIDDRVFFAMELVDGPTLREWLEAKRSWREVVRVFVQAGRGLAAAHHAGIVHRDFKPENVLVGADGRVRVTDFGIAAAARGEAVPPEPELTKRTSVLSQPITRPGTFLGTPAYMAPEQLAGDPADARSDQFAFCVTLYEALYGERPFGGDTLAELSSAIREGKLRAAPKDSLVPARVRRTLVRGLEPKPSDRFGSMDDLISTLDPTTPVSRYPWIVAALAAVIAVAAVWGARAGTRDARAVCEAVGVGMWDAAQKKSVSDAFRATGKPFADDAFRATERALDAYATAWAVMHRDACLATRARGEQSEELLDLRMQCLSRRAAELRALTSRLSHADAQIVERSVEAALALEPIDTCANAEALRAPPRLPADERSRKRIADVRATLADAKALRDTGRIAEALRLATEGESAAKTLGYAPLEGEALLARGDLEDMSDAKSAEDTLRMAARVAETAHDDAILADASIALMRRVGVARADLDRAEDWGARAEVALERLGNVPEQLAKLLEARGSVYKKHGMYPQAYASFERALALREKAAGAASPLTARTLSKMGTVLIDLGRFDEALAACERALSIGTHELGPAHPEVASLENNLGEVLRRLGRGGDALVHLRRSLAIAEAAFGSDHTAVGGALNNIANTLEEQGEYDEALEYHERALRMFEKLYGPNDPNVARSLTNRGNVLLDLGRWADARADQERAIRIVEAVFGPEHPDVAIGLTNLGDVLMAQGRPREAMAPYERALAIREKTLGTDHPRVARALTNVARALVRTGGADRAIPLLERALAVQEKRTVRPVENAETRFALAEALVARGGDRARARLLASEARAAYAAAGAAGRKELARIDTWLARP